MPKEGLIRRIPGRTWLRCRAHMQRRRGGHFFHSWPLARSARGATLDYLHRGLPLPRGSARGCGGGYRFFNPTWGICIPGGPDGSGLDSSRDHWYPYWNPFGGRLIRRLLLPSGLAHPLHPNFCLAKQIGHRRHDHSLGRVIRGVIETCSNQNGQSFSPI